MSAVVPPSGNELAAVSEALAGEYEIVQELGRGGMAIVYRATERSLGREVAIKVLPFTFAFDADFVERFQREARTAARLEHPHIIPIYRVGRADNVIYFTMKFLRGESLARSITRESLQPHEIRRLLKEAGSALGYAHQHGVVHRDVKPDNIMFHESGHVVVCDFGIAKAASESKLTGTGTTIGTPHYMSPEQARAHKVDGRSDLYSLGVVAYKCLTGRVPFDAEDSFAIGIKHITEPLPRPELETPEHEAIFGVVARLMEKEPDDRFPNAEEMIRAVEELGPTFSSAPAISASAIPTASVDSSAPTQYERPAETPETPTTPMPPSSVEPPPARKHGSAPRGRRPSHIPALVSAAVLIVGVGGGWLALNRGSTPAGPPGSTPAVTIAGGPSEAATATDPPAGNRSAATEGEAAPTLSPDAQPVRAVAPPERPSEPNVRTDRQPPTEPANRTRAPITPAVPPPPVADSPGARAIAPRELRDTAPTRPLADPTPPDPGARPAPRPGQLVDSLKARAEKANVGLLRIRGLAGGAKLYIDGKLQTRLSHTLPVGPHVIRVERDGYETFERRVEIKAGEATRVRVMQSRRDD